MSGLTSRVVEHDGPAYHKIVAMRRRILRIPLGLDFSAEDLAAESVESHLGVWDGDRLVACAVIQWPGEYAKVRQVAVEPDCQGRGLGRRIMDDCADEARRRGMGMIVLNARDTAVPFYLALGYEIEGPEFEEVTIPHRRMTLRL